MNTKVNKSHTMGGISFTERTTIASDGTIVHNVSVPAAEAGSLSTRTDDTDGTFTMTESAHGISSADRLDIYWAGGCRRGALVGTVSGASVPFSGGSGDNLPVQGTAVTVSVPTELDVTVLGTNVVAILLYAQIHGQFVFEDAGGEELAKELEDGVVWSWHEDEGSDNPITGDSIIIVYASHDDSTAARTMQVGVAYDND